MRSKTSCFNGAIIRSCLARYWPVWGSALLIWCIILPVMTLSGGSYDDGPRFFARELLDEAGFTGGIVMNALYALLAAMAVFSFLYNARSTAYLAALPVRREGLFLSCWLAGFLMLAGVGAATAVLTLLAQLAVNAVSLAAIGRWLGFYLMQALCFYGLASFCAVLTGCLWALPALYVVLNFLAIGLWLLLSGVLAHLVYGYAALGEGLARTLTPIVRMFAWQWEPDYPSLLALALYALGGLLLSALALFIFRRRRMEAATDVVAVKALKPAFRWCLALGCALTLTNILYDLTINEDFQTGWTLVFALPGGLVGWLAAEMLNRKSFRVWRSLRGFLVFAVLLAALLIGCGNGCFGYEKHVPAQEQVASVSFDYYGSHGEVTDPADVALLREVHTALTGLKGAVGSSQGRLYLTYTLHTGVTAQREYRLKGLSQNLLDRLNALAEKVERQKLLALELENAGVVDCDVRFSRPEDGVSQQLEPVEARLLFRDYLLPDLREGSVFLTENPAAEDDGELAYIYMEFMLPRDREWNDYVHYAFRITPAATRTWSALQALS